MSADSLVAVIGLLLGFYTIAPRWFQLDLDLRRSRRHSVVAFLAMIAVYYLLLFPFFMALGLSPKLGLHRWNFFPADAAFVLVTVVVAYFIISLYNFKLKPRKLPALERLIEEAADEVDYWHVLRIIDRHLDSLLKISELGSRKRQVLTWPWRSHSAEIKEGDAEDDSQKAKNILASILRNEETASSLARRRPVLSIRLLRIEMDAAFVFCNSYIQGLIETPGSSWYSELRSSDNSTDHRYDIDRTGIINYLLGDVQNASRLGVYRAVGEWVIRELDRRARRPLEDEYNLFIDDFDDVDKWRSALWTAIRFFDVMMLEAIWQGVKSHMWVYYMTYFVKGVVRNCKFGHDSLVVLNSTYPNRYCYLLAEILGNLSKWISQARFVPAGQANLVMQKPADRFENENPVKSSIFALVQCVHFIANSGGHLPAGFRRDLLRKVISCYFDLREVEHCVPYADVLAQLLSNGGPTRWPEKERRRVATMIRDSLKAMDLVRVDHQELDKFRLLFATGVGVTKRRRFSHAPRTK